MTVTDHALSFDLGEELSLVQDAARDFADGVLAPLASKHDREETISDDVYKQLGELGFWGLTLPEQYGGVGLDPLSTALCLEAFGHGCTDGGLVFAVCAHLLACVIPVVKHGSEEQKQRYLPDLCTGKRIAVNGMTEPDSGSDAFGSMLATARRDGDEYVLNGNKTFITNGPYADTIVFICKLDEGNDPKDRKILSFVLDSGMPGLTQSKPLRKMGMHSSPTGELFLDDVRAGKDRLIGEDENPPKGGRDGAKATFQQERAGVAAMALGIIEECLELSIAYSKERVQFGQPIGEFQLIQQKLAMMEVARMNIQNLVFRTIELSNDAKTMTFAEASAMKLYSAQQATACALEAVQLHGGNGYMAEYHVEQLARDAKVLQIYAGTDEIQTRAIARSLLAD